MPAPTVVSAEGVIEAWRAGAAELVKRPLGEVFGLVTTIEIVGAEDRRLLSKFDAKNVGGSDTVFGVAAVLFPLLPRSANETTSEFLDRCARVLERSRQRGILRGGWGTYFERLRGMGGADCQILRAIRAYTDWKNAPKAAAVMHTSSPQLDNIRALGAPCLQFVEITRPNENTLDLMAVYRNHDFVEKSLGNFVGLARLLRFICSDTGYEAGSITCHSVHAYGQKKKLKALLAA